MLLQQETVINCPYCGEPISVLIEDSAGSQSYYEDCSVCCAPILFVLTEDESGVIQLDTKKDDD